MNALYPSVARRAEYRCEYCRAPEVVFNATFEVEHVCPTSRGGSDDPENLALACRACNVHKGEALTATDPETGGEVPLFNPRTDRWADHFQYDHESGALNGLTAVGRATVARLDMNHPRQLAARQLWGRLRLFP